MSTSEFTLLLNTSDDSSYVTKSIMAIKQFAAEDGLSIDIDIKSKKIHSIGDVLGYQLPENGIDSEKQGLRIDLTIDTKNNEPAVNKTTLINWLNDVDFDGNVYQYVVFTKNQAQALLEQDRPDNKPEFTQVKYSELDDMALQWAIATCEGLPVYFDGESLCLHSDTNDPPCPDFLNLEQRHINIALRENIVVQRRGGNLLGYKALKFKLNPHNSLQEGKSNELLFETDFMHSAAIAAMRCYVLSKMGENVNIPTILLPAASNKARHGLQSSR